MTVSGTDPRSAIKMKRKKKKKGRIASQTDSKRRQTARAGRIQVIMKEIEIKKETETGLIHTSEVTLW